MDKTQMITRIIAFPKPMIQEIDKRCVASGIKDTWFVRAAVTYALAELSDTDISALITKEYEKYHTITNQ